MSQAKNIQMHNPDFTPKKQRYLHQIRQATWAMDTEEDISKVLLALRNGLAAFNTHFHECAINLVRGVGPPPNVWVYYIQKRGMWELASTKTKTEVLHRIWAEGYVAYRRDLDLEDPYHEAERIRRHYDVRVRSIIDVPFSHGTLALNSSCPNAFSAELIKWLEGAADMLSMSFQRVDDLRQVSEAEKRYRAIAELVSDDIYTIEAEEDGVFAPVSWAPVNDSQITGFSRQHILNKGGWLAFVHEKDQDTARQHLEAAWAGQTHVQQYRVFDNEGRIHWVRDYVRPQVSPDRRQVLFICGAVQDITHQMELEESFRSFSRRTLQAQEDERRRLARELHDGVNPLLLTAGLNIHSAITGLKKRQITSLSELEEGRMQINEAIKEIRQISRSLRPSVLDDLGFEVALTSLISEFRKTTEIEVELAYEVVPEQLDADIENNLYRMFQEVMNNIKKHADASRVWIELKSQAGQLMVRVKDDGKGFDVEKALQMGKGIGLRNLRERALLMKGNLVCKRASPQGTEITIHLPVQQR